MITFTSPRRNGRASATFCWLPPLRNWTGCSIDAVRIRRRSTTSSTVVRSRAATDPAHPREAPQHLERGVGPDAEDREHRLAPAIAAEQHDAGPQRARRRGDVDLAPSHVTVPDDGSTPASACRNGSCPLPSAPAMPRISPRRTFRSIGPKRSPCRPAMSSVVSDPSTAPHAVRERLLQRAPDHERHEALLGHVDGVVGALPDAVAQHRHAVRDAEHLGEAVADVDDADARVPPGRGRARAAARPPAGPATSWARPSASTFGSDCSALTTSSICRFGQRQAAHRRRHVDLQVVRLDDRRRPPLHARRTTAARRAAWT